MKRRRSMILSAATVAFLVSRDCYAQVYATGVYSTGTTYYGAGSTRLPFPPFEYDMTEISWGEDRNGGYIVNPVDRKSEPGDVTRRRLEVQCGSEIFYLPLDSGPARRWKSDNDPPIVKSSGDFASVVTQCATNRGGRTTTNALPVIQASWIRGSRTNEDIFVLDGQRFSEVQKFLEQAYGKPDPAIHSTLDAGGDCRSIYYTPAQIGVFLNLSRTWDDTTIVSILGKRKPKSFERKNE